MKTERLLIKKNSSKFFVLIFLVFNILGCGDNLEEESDEISIKRQELSNALFSSTSASQNYAPFATNYATLTKLDLNTRYEKIGRVLIGDTLVNVNASNSDIVHKFEMQSHKISLHLTPEYFLYCTIDSFVQSAPDHPTRTFPPETGLSDEIVERINETSEDPDNKGCREDWRVFVDLDQNDSYSESEMILHKSEAGILSYQVHILEPGENLSLYETNSFVTPFLSPVKIPFGEELKIKIVMTWSGNKYLKWGDVFEGKIILNKFDPEEKNPEELANVNHRITQIGGKSVDALDWGHDILKAHQYANHSRATKQGFEPLHDNLSAGFAELDYKNHEQDEDLQTLQNYDNELNVAIAKYDDLVKEAKDIHQTEIDRIDNKIDSLKSEMKACGAWLSPLAIPVLRFALPFFASSAIKCVQRKQQEVATLKYERRIEQKLLTDRLSKINAERTIEEEEITERIRRQNQHIENRHILAVLHKKAYSEVSEYIQSEEQRRLQNLHEVATKYQADMSDDLKQIREYEKKARELESFSYVTEALKDSVINEIKLIPNFIDSVVKLEEEVKKIEEFFKDIENVVNSGDFDGLIKDMEGAVGLPLYDSIRKIGLTDAKGDKSKKLQKETEESLMRNAFKDLPNIDGLLAHGNYVDYHDYVDPTSDWFNRVKNNIAFMISGFDNDPEDLETSGNSVGTVFPLPRTFYDINGPFNYSYNPDLYIPDYNYSYDLDSYEICRVAQNKELIKSTGQTETLSNIEIGFVYNIRGKRVCASVINQNIPHYSFEVLRVSSDYEWASPRNEIRTRKKPVKITTDNNGSGIWGRAAINSHICSSSVDPEKLGFEHEHSCSTGSIDSDGFVTKEQLAYGDRYNQQVTFLYASDYAWIGENLNRETRNTLKERNAYFTNHSSKELTVYNYHYKTKRLQAKETAYNFFTYVLKDNYHIIDGVDYGKEQLTLQMLIFMEQSLDYFAVNRPVEVPSLFLGDRPSVMVFSDPSKDFNTPTDSLILFNQDYDYESPAMRFEFFLEELGHMVNWFRCKKNQIGPIHQKCFKSGDEGARFKDALLGYDMTEDIYLQRPLADNYSPESLNKRLEKIREVTLSQNRKTYIDFIQSLDNYADDTILQVETANNVPIYIKTYNKTSHYGDNLLGGNKATLLTIMQAGVEIPSEMSLLADKYALQFIYFAPKLARKNHPYEFYDPSATNLTDDPSPESKKNVPTYILHFSVHDELNVVTNRSTKIRNATKSGIGAAGVWIRNHGVELPVQDGKLVNSEVHYIKEIIFRLELDINLMGAICQSSSKICNPEKFESKGAKAFSGIGKFLGKFGQSTIGLELGFVIKAKGDLWRKLLAIDMSTAIAGAIAGAIVGVITGTDPVTWAEFGSLTVESIATAVEIAAYRNNPLFTSLMFTSASVSLPFDFNILTGRKAPQRSYDLEESRRQSIWTVDADTGEANAVNYYANMPDESLSTPSFSNRRKRAFTKLKNNLRGANAVFTIYPRYNYTFYHHNFKKNAPSDNEIDRD